MANMRANNICVRQAADIPLDGIPLSEDQMSDVDLLKGMWVATLAHELGHNFGLRHNFVGSFDAANFKFHPGEASGRTYSSIMDYLVDDHVTYDGFGPYDVAALRAAYTGMVELHPAVQGQVLSLIHISEPTRRM